jgi:hypothetical protein
MTDREAMRQALEALEMYLTLDTPEEAHMLETYIAPRAYAALKQAIEQAEKQEPVGYWDGEFSKDGGAVLYEMPQNEVFMVHQNIPLYAAPPNLQKAAEHWHGLYLAKCRELHDERARLGQQICDLEHDLKEKNHG